MKKGEILNVYYKLKGANLKRHTEHPEKVKTMETEKRPVVARAWEREK